MTVNNDRILIIGASAAGWSAVREIRGKNREIEVVIFSEEKNTPYYRPYLTEYIGNRGVMEKSNFYIISDEWCRDQNVVFKKDERVTGIDTGSCTITTEKEEEFSYNRLILACGSTPFVPHQEALAKSNVFSLRTLDDAEKVYRFSNNITRATIIGGGLLGLEAAYSLIRKGIEVTVIELCDRLLPNQLDDEGSLFLKRIISGDKLRLMLGKRVASIAGEDTATAIELEGGETVETEMVIYSVGIRSNTKIARDAGIAVNRAVVVNEKMETSVPGIYACGDVAEYNGRTVALWMNAVRQGKVAGLNAAGVESVIGNEIYPAVLNSFGTKIFSAGDVCAAAGSDGLRHISSCDDTKGNYRKLYFKDDALAGFILIGDISESQKLLNGLKTGLTYSRCTASY